MVIRKCRFSSGTSILMNEMKEIADPSGANGSSGQVEQKWVIKCGVPSGTSGTNGHRKAGTPGTSGANASGSTEFPEVEHHRSGGNCRIK
jgi:hypothetical protein